MATLYQDRQLVSPNLARVGERVGTYEPVLNLESARRPVVVNAGNVSASAGTGNAGGLVNGLVPYQQPNLEEAAYADTVNTRGEFVKGMLRGVDLLQASAGGAVGILGDAINSPYLVQSGVDMYERNIAEQQENAAAVPTLSDINSVGTFFDWAAGKAGEAVPMIAPSIVTGIGGAVVGGTAAGMATVGSTVGASTIAKQGANALVKNRLNNYIKKEIGQEAWDGYTDQVKTNLTNRFITREVAKARTAQGAAFLQGAVTEAGLNWAEVASVLDNPSESNAGLAVTLGSIAGGLELVGIEGSLLRKITGLPVSPAAEKQFKTGIKGFLQRRLVGAMKGGVTEGGTEALQEVLNILNTVAQVDGSTMFDSAHADQVLEALAAGSLIGVGIGGVMPQQGPVTSDSPQDTMRKKESELSTNNLSANNPVEDPQTDTINPNNIGLGGFPERVDQKLNTSGLNAFPERSNNPNSLMSNTAVSTRNGLTSMPGRTGSVYKDAPINQGLINSNNLNDLANPATSEYNARLSEIEQQQTVTKQDTNRIITDLNASKAQLIQQQKQAQDVDEKVANDLKQQIKQVNDNITFVLANQARLDELAAEQKKDISKSIDKVNAGLTKEQMEAASRRSKIQTQPRLSNQEVQSAIVQSKREVEEVTKAQANNIRAHIKNLMSDITTENSNNGYTPKLQALQKELQAANNKLSKMYADSDKLVKQYDTLDSDRQLDPLADATDKFFNDYRMSDKDIDPLARTSRYEAEKAFSDDTIKSIEAQQKDIKNKISLIKQDPNLNEVSKTLSTATLQEQLNALENSKITSNMGRLNNLANNVEADLEYIQRKQQESIKEIGDNIDAAIEYDSSVVNNDIRVTNEQIRQTANESLDLSVTPVPGTLPTDLIDAEIAVDNADINVANTELQQDIETFISNDRTDAFETYLSNIDTNELRVDTNLSTIRDSNNDFGFSPAKKQIANSMNTSMQNSSALQGVDPQQQAQMLKGFTDNLYTQEVAEALAAEAAMEPYKNAHDKTTSTNDIIKGLKKIAKVFGVKDSYLDRVVFIESPTDIGMPVELQNIVATNNNVLSAYHNGRVYVFTAPFRQQYSNPIPAIHREIISTLSGTIGLEESIIDVPSIANQFDKTIGTDLYSLHYYAFGSNGPEKTKHDVEVAIRKAIAKSMGITNYNAQEVSDVFYSSQKRQLTIDIAAAQTYISTIDNTTLNLDMVPPMWGLLFGNINQANQYIETKTKSIEASYEPDLAPESTILKYSEPLKNQTPFIKNIFSNILRPTQNIIDNGNGTFSVRVSGNSSGVNSVVANMDPITGAPFATKGAAQYAIKSGLVLNDIPMSALLTLHDGNSISPKGFAKTLRALGVRGADYDGRMTLFAGDDVDLIAYFPDLQPQSELQPEIHNIEDIVQASSLVSDNIQDLTVAEQEAFQQYFIDELEYSKSILSESQKSYMNGVQSIINKFPYLRDKVVIVRDWNDARVPHELRENVTPISRNVSGIYNAEAGMVYIQLNSDAATMTTSDVAYNEGVKTIVHEGIVHLGFASMFTPEQKTKFLDVVLQSINHADNNSDLVKAFNQFSSEVSGGYSSADANVLVEEFIAWVAEGIDLNKDFVTPSIATWYTRILDYFKSIINKVIGIDSPVLTIQDIHNSIKASAYNLQQKGGDVAGTYYNNGTVTVVESVPVESKFLAGASFTDLASAIGYTSDVINSQEYSLGLPQSEITSSDVLNVKAALNSNPQLYGDVVALGIEIQSDMTVMQAIDTLQKGYDDSYINDLLRKSGIKIVIADDKFISLYPDVSILYPEDNHSRSVGFLRSVQEYISAEDVTSTSEILTKLYSKSPQDVNNILSDVVNNVKRIRTSEKTGDTSKLTTMDTAIKSMLRNRAASTNDSTTVNPNAGVIIENLGFVQTAKYKAYKFLTQASQDWERYKERANNPEKEFGLKDLNLDSLMNKYKGQYIDQYNAIKVTIEGLQKAYGNSVRVGDKIVKTVGDITAHNLLSTSSNKIARRAQKYEEDFIKPILASLTKVKIPGKYKTQEEATDAVFDAFDLLAHAEHAKERNRELRKRGADQVAPDPSGMSDEVADNTIEMYSGAEYAPLREAVKKVQQMNSKILDDFYNAGMIKEEDYRRIKDAYSSYVPLISDDLATKLAPELTFNRSSSGLSTNKRRIVKWAKGYSSEVEISPVLAQSIRKAYDSTVVIEKNNVGRKILETVLNVNTIEDMLIKQGHLDYKDSSKELLWEIADMPGMDKDYSGIRINKNQMIEVTPKSHKFEGQGYDLLTVVDNNGNINVVAIKDPQLGAAIKATNVEVPSAIFKYMGMVTRQLSRLMTGRSPQFIITNPIRDIQQSVFNVSSALTDNEYKTLFGVDKKDTAGKANIVSDVRKRMMSAYGDKVASKLLLDYFRASSKKISGLKPKSLEDLKERYSGKKATPEMKALWADFEDFLDNGGKTTVVAMLDLEDTFKNVRDEVRKAKDDDGKRKAMDTALGYLDALSDTSESMVRFATYRAYYDNAKSKIEQRKDIDANAKAELLANAKHLAARAALDSTVNFGRKGSKAGIFNAAYAFTSAALQSANRTINHFWRKDDTLANNVSRVARYIGGFALSGALVASICLATMPEDEDGISRYYKIPSYERMNNIIIPAPFFDSGYIKIPLPYGVNALYAMGVNTHDVIMGRKSIGVAATESLKSLYSTGIPWNLPGEGIGALIPTIARPVYQIYANKTFAGTPIMPEKAFDSQPDSERAWDSTSGFWKTISDVINTGTLGDKYNPGLISISPETIEHIATQYTGGLGRLFGDMINLGNMIGAGGTSTVPSPRIPVLSGVVGLYSTSGTSSMYYSLGDKITTAQTAIKESNEDSSMSLADRNSVIARYTPYDSIADKYTKTQSQIQKIREKITDRTSLKQKDSYNKQIEYLQKQMIKYADSKGLVTLD